SPGRVLLQEESEPETGELVLDGQEWRGELRVTLSPEEMSYLTRLNQLNDIDDLRALRDQESILLHFLPYQPLELYLREENDVELIKMLLTHETYANSGLSKQVDGEILLDAKFGKTTVRVCFMCQ